MTDDHPDITNPKTFALYAVLMIIFGAIIGAGFHITFAGLNISLTQGLQIIFVLFGTGFVIAALYHKIPEIVEWVIETEEDEDEE